MIVGDGEAITSSEGVAVTNATGEGAEIDCLSSGIAVVERLVRHTIVATATTTKTRSVAQRFQRVVESRSVPETAGVVLSRILV